MTQGETAMTEQVKGRDRQPIARSYSVEVKRKVLKIKYPLISLCRTGTLARPGVWLEMQSLRNWSEGSPGSQSSSKTLEMVGIVAGEGIIIII